MARAARAGRLAFPGNAYRGGPGDRAAAGAGVRAAPPPARGFAGGARGHPRRARDGEGPQPRLPSRARGWLGVRDAREAAREALCAQGDDALDALDRALADPRAHARPRAPPADHQPLLTAAGGGGAAAASAVERDGRVRFKILRGLGRIATDHAEVALDDALVRALAAGTADAAAEALRLRVGLARGAEHVPSRATPAHLLLVTLLRDKEDHRIERFFRLLQLRLRKEDVRSIHRGLRNADRRVRAASRELLENLLEERLRATVMALVDDLPDEERLARIPRDPGTTSTIQRLLSA